MGEFQARCLSGVNDDIGNFTLLGAAEDIPLSGRLNRALIHRCACGFVDAAEKIITLLNHELVRVRAGAHQTR
jgi:hypothetical protein